MIDLQQFKTGKHLGVGCSTFGGSTSKKVALHSLEYCFDKGMVYFDLARSYGYGKAEAIFSEFAKAKRHKILITTKFGILPSPNIPFKSLVSAGLRQVRKVLPSTQSVIKKFSNSALQKSVFTPSLALSSLHKSLFELKTDYVDYFLLHEGNLHNMMRDDMHAVMEQAMQQGKIRGWGGTISDKQDLPEISKMSLKPGLLQVPFGTDHGYAVFARETGMQKVIYSVMSHRPGFTAEKDKARFDLLAPSFSKAGHPRNMAELMLFLAYHELNAGVLLLSMTSETHIDRNLEIIRSKNPLPEKIIELKNLLLLHNLPKQLVASS